MTDKELSAKIDRYVSIRPMANEYQSLGGEIKDELLLRKEHSFDAPSGARARVKLNPQAEWLVEALKAVLPRAVFDALCPRKPDAVKLNQRLAAMPEDKALAKCRMPKGDRKELEVLAAGAE